MMQKTLLEVDNLRTYFYTDEGVVRAVDGATFMVERGGTLGIVGESGCGKTITALSTLQLVPQPRGRIAGGRITYHQAGAKPIDITALHPHSCIATASSSCSTSSTRRTPGCVGGHVSRT